MKRGDHVLEGLVAGEIDLLAWACARSVRLMREEGLQVRPRRRFVRTTDSDHDGPIFPDRAKDMAPSGPDRLWVADITYIPTLSGFLYLAVILDVFSRKIVGWSMATHLRSELVISALTTPGTLVSSATP